MSMERTKKTDDEELNDFKKKLADKAMKAKMANQKHRQNIKQKLNAVKTEKDDERLEEVLDVVKEIKKLMLDLDPISDSSESESESEDEDEVKPKKKKLKAISEDEDDEEKPKKKKILKKKKKKDEDDVLEPDVSDDLQLKRKFPYLHKYPTYV
jgi:hypothetical protein